ncbi:hypothetical protein V7S43_015459 [Phytophthora oleae]|uniref:Uncharacterized protein n=1 Tax=Phytophthora oleae TaxID=2107226 RepID=A0ABD3EYE4_9STRA
MGARQAQRDGRADDQPTDVLSGPQASPPGDQVGVVEEEPTEGPTHERTANEGSVSEDQLQKELNSGLEVGAPSGVREVRWMRRARPVDAVAVAGEQATKTTSRARPRSRTRTRRSRELQNENGSLSHEEQVVEVTERAEQGTS